MTARRAVRRIAAALAAACLAACGDPVQPDRGSIALDLLFAAPDDSTGALLLTLSRGADSVTAGTAAVHAGGQRLLLLGTLAPGARLAHVWVPASEAASYGVVIQQAANRVTFARRPVAGLGVSLAGPP